MIYLTPDNQPAPQKPTQSTAQTITIAAVALLIAGWIGYQMGGGDQIHARGVESHTLDQVAVLNNGTTITIDDIREEQELTARNTTLTVTYQAGDNGHHPTGIQPTLTGNGETHYPDTGIFITTSKGLDEPLAPKVEKTIKIGYNVPIQTLANAQLHIDGQLFVGNFNERINNGR